MAKLNDLLSAVKRYKSDEVPDSLLLSLIQEVLNRDVWYLFTLKAAIVPYIEDGKGFIFTDEKKAESGLYFGGYTAKQVCEISVVDEFDENVFAMLIRYGCKEVVFNSGADNEMKLNVEVFAPDIVNREGIKANMLLSDLYIKALMRDEDDNSVVKTHQELIKELCAEKRHGIVFEDNYYIFTDYAEALKGNPLIVRPTHMVDVNTLLTDTSVDEVIVNNGSLAFTL